MFVFELPFGNGHKEEFKILVILFFYKIRDLFSNRLRAKYISFFKRSCLWLQKRFWFSLETYCYLRFVKTTTHGDCQYHSSTAEA